MNTGLWKRTIVYRDEVPHNFPKPHTDVLEQFVDYKVPVGKFDGTRLTPVPSGDYFWFAWAAFRPETRVWR
jgi:hypothetical protein